MFNFKRLASDFISVLFPDCCMACGEELYHGENQICISCLFDLPFTDFQYYPDNAVAKLFWGRIQCDQAMAMLYFQKANRVQKMIHQIKYQAKTDLGFKLGTMLGERLSNAPHYAGAEMVIPVPLHQKKEKSRGYNQSKCIADGIAYSLRIPVETGLLIRHIATGSQTKKNRYTRYESMKDVFNIAEPEALYGKHVILVDDVVTTGATLEACGQQLLNSGIGKLSIVALAYTV